MANFQTNPPINLLTFRNNFYGGAGSVSLEGIRGTVFGNDTRLRSMSQYIGTSFWRYRILSDNSARGFVQMTYPQNSGTVYDWTSSWFWTGNYGYASIYAQGTYPYNFQYWYYDGGAIFSYGSAPNVNFNATGVLTLRAYFA